MKCGDRRRNDDGGGSLPTRGAWIEIPLARRLVLTHKGRSPHGERGSKSRVAARSGCRVVGVPCIGNVDRNSIIYYSNDAEGVRETRKSHR